MRIIGCQYEIIWQDKAANQEQVRSLLGAAASPAGAWVVLPEMFDTGFSLDVDAVAEDARCLSQTFLAELAQEFQVFVLGGIVKRSPAGRARNEAVIYSPQGEELARYGKLHPFSIGGEADHIEAGGEIVTVDLHEFMAAPFICYDLRFPEIFRIARQRGAELLVVIANWPVARSHHWHTLLCARAIENQAYVVGINRCGSDPNYEYGGDSMIVDPRGQTLASADENTALITADLDLQALLDYREQFPIYKDSRPEFLAPPDS